LLNIISDQTDIIKCDNYFLPTEPQIAFKKKSKNLLNIQGSAIPLHSYVLFLRQNFKTLYL